jgi:soluble lytic murein transglycosylase-like protein
MGPRTTLLYLALSLTVVTAPCRADCFDTAAKAQHVSPRWLRGIARVESQNNPHAIHRNKNGTVDYGMMQINSVHLRELKRQGIKKRDLMNACKNISVAAGMLHQKVSKYGPTWKAVGAYHSETPRERNQYARKVQQEILHLASAD